MISLRELKLKDAPMMLEWMHDVDIQKAFQKNMLDKTLAEAEQFCLAFHTPSSPSTGDDLHFAIVDEYDEYLGTISLKNFNMESKNAEYAISTRKKAHGKNIAYQATQEILKIAFEHYKLHKVYLNVFANNFKAIKLYERCGFCFEGEHRECCWVEGEYISLRWYGILENEYRIWKYR